MHPQHGLFATHIVDPVYNEFQHICPCIGQTMGASRSIQSNRLKFVENVLAICL
jgi:hypothetical protein